MSIIGWIILGAIAGWISSLIMHRRESWWADIILGIVGALVGGFVWGLLTGTNFVAHFNVGTLLVAIGGGSHCPGDLGSHSRPPLTQLGKRVFSSWRPHLGGHGFLELGRSS